MIRFLREGSDKKGFTLIELLVVIAIIGILASIVLASLNTARQKSRDARRLSDMHELQNALTLYYSDNNEQYSPDLASLASTFIPVVPTDPVSTGTQYQYAGLTDGVDTTCVSYHLGATLEQTNNVALNNDADAPAGTACTGSAADFNGSDTITPGLYDVIP